MNLPTIADFKHDLHAALGDRFALSKADAVLHPFVGATVLDPVTKPCELFPELLRNAAYDHVQCESKKVAPPQKKLFAIFSLRLSIFP